MLVRRAFFAALFFLVAACGGGNDLGGGTPLPPRELTSPSPDSSAFFGTSVAFSGALSFVGSPSEDKIEGRAFSLGGSGGQELANPTGQNGSEFGFAVAGNALLSVVGAPREAAADGTPVGGAYAFRSGTTELLLSVHSENPQDGGLFGFSLAVANQNFVVGAPGEDVGTVSGAGRAYYFDCVIEDALAVVISPNPAQGGNFGFAVATRDFEVFVGAPGESNGEGRVYWFDGLTGRLLGTFLSPNAQGNGEFGASLAVDGVRLVVGAPGETGATGVPGIGAVYVFDLSAISSAARELASPDETDGGRYGAAVAIAGALVYGGAPGEGATAGRVQVFDLGAGEFLPALLSPNEQAGGAFGASVAANGVNVIVGAPNEDAGTVVAAGRAYVNPGGLPIFR